MKTPDIPTPARLSVLLHVRGLEIEAQCGEGGVVNLVVRAQQQHKGLWRRIGQHAAHALYRIADACNPGDDGGGLRVVLCEVPGAAVNDGLPKLAHKHVRQVWPLHAANGDAYYVALLVHEGVKRHHDGRPATADCEGFGWQKCADDAHAANPEVEGSPNVPHGHAVRHAVRFQVHRALQLLGVVCVMGLLLALLRGH